MTTNREHSTLLNMNKISSVALIIIGLVMILPASRVYALNEMPLIAQLQGEHNGSHYGESLVSLDFDHDGIDDLVVYSYCQKLAKPIIG